MYTVSQLAKMIDHSILHPTWGDQKLEEECTVAIKYHVASVCVKPYAVPKAAAMLRGTDVRVGTVAGFPHGNSTLQVKVFETETAIRDGATEIDIVLNIAKVLEKDWSYTEKELNAIVSVTSKHHVLLKVIFENDFLPEKESIIKLAQLCTQAGCDYIKTSTGYGFVKQENGMYSYKGATIGDLRLMRLHAGPAVAIKAAGGVRDLATFLQVVEAGATRIGATATAEILEEAGMRFPA